MQKCTGHMFLYGFVFLSLIKSVAYSLESIILIISYSDLVTSSLITCPLSQIAPARMQICKFVCTHVVASNSKLTRGD